MTDQRTSRDADAERWRERRQRKELERDENGFSRAWTDQKRWDKGVRKRLRQEAALPPMEEDSEAELLYRICAHLWAAQRTLAWIRAGVWVTAGIALALFLFGFEIQSR